MAAGGLLRVGKGKASGGLECLQEVQVAEIGALPGKGGAALGMANRVPAGRAASRVL